MNEALFTQFTHFMNLLQRINNTQPLPQTQSKILMILDKHKTLSQKSLNECMQIRSSSLSELLTKLEGKGYIEKDQDLQDKRIVNLQLTDKGRAGIKNITRTQNDMIDHVFSPLSEDEKSQLVSAMEKIIDFIDDEVDTENNNFCCECGICTYGYKKKRRA